jgi:hypothetical protein
VYEAEMEGEGKKKMGKREEMRKDLVNNKQLMTGSK